MRFALRRFLHFPDEVEAEVAAEVVELLVELDEATEADEDVGVDEESTVEEDAETLVEAEELDDDELEAPSHTAGPGFTKLAPLSEYTLY